MGSSIRNILQVKGDFVWSISPDATVFEALRLMAAKDVGVLIVMEGEKMVGILSERDYARKVILEGKASKDTRVSEIMTKDLVTIHPSQTNIEAMELMTNNHIRHLPVVDNNKVVGVISMGDVVRDIIYSQKEKIKGLEDLRRK